MFAFEGIQCVKLNFEMVPERCASDWLVEAFVWINLCVNNSSLDMRIFLSFIKASKGWKYLDKSM